MIIVTYTGWSIIKKPLTCTIFEMKVWFWEKVVKIKVANLKLNFIDQLKF